MNKIAIIGAGLAGTACAYVLKNAGHEPVIYEGGDTLAGAASGNALGLYNPRFTAELNAVGHYYSSAFQRALKTFALLSRAGADIGWNACGALHLINDEKKDTRFTKMLESWGWPEDEMRIISAAEATDISGVVIERDALYLSQAGYVSPPKLCAAYAAGVEVKTNTKIESLSAIDADAVIIANGQGAKAFEETKHLPLNGVRGQITRVKATQASRKMQCNIQYGGYISPAIDAAKGQGWHMLGSTFQRWLDHDELIEEDNADNIAKLAQNVPALGAAFEVLDARAAVRTTAPDHFPVVGHVQDHIYISTAHGSHGIISTIEAAHLIASLIAEETPKLPEKTVEALSPLRYHPSA